MFYVIGDLHSNISELKKLLKHIKPKKADALIFLGDLIDKNPDTLETLDFLTSLDRKIKCIFVRGNHEFVWDEYLNGKNLERREFLLNYGGKEALTYFEEGLLEKNNLSKIKKILSKYLKILEKMVPYFIVSNYIIIHGGLLPSQLTHKKLEIKEENYFLRPDKIDKNKKYLKKYRVIAGHTFIKTTPFFSESYINIDSGAGYGKYLSAYCIENEEVIRSDGAVFREN